MENERRMTPAERTQEVQRMTIRIIELERDLPDLYPGAAREAVLDEIDRCKYRLTSLLEDREDQAMANRRKPRRTRSSKFYAGAFLLLAVFLLSGAVAAAAITATVMLIGFFTSEPPPPAYAGDSSVVVKE